MTVYELVRDIVLRYMRMGPYWQLFTLLSTMIFAVLIVLIAKRRNLSPVKCIFTILLFFYLINIYVLAVVARRYLLVAETNFDLFWSWKKAYFGNKYFLSLVIENMLMLVPVGILMPLIVRKKNRVLITIFCGFLMSLAIESSQYIRKTGLFEIDDLIDNTIGVIIGCILTVQILNIIHK